MNRAVIFACLLVAVMAMQPLNAVRVLDGAAGALPHPLRATGVARNTQTAVHCCALTDILMLCFVVSCCAGASRTLLQDGNVTAGPSPAGEAASLDGCTHTQCQQNASIDRLAFVQVLIRGLTLMHFHGLHS